MIPTLADRYPVVYLITCLVTGKIYVGSSSDFYERYGFYLSRYNCGRRDRAIERAMQKYGWEQFVFSILERPSENCLIETEQRYLNELKPFGKRGYNQSTTAGSIRGFKHSEESKARMSIASKGRVFSRESIERRAAANRGKKRTPEQIQRNKDARLRGFLAKQQPVLQIEKETLRVLAEHSSCYEAAKGDCKRHESIKQVCRRERPSAYGYHWIYKHDYNPETYSPLSPKISRINSVLRGKQPIVQLDLERRPIKIWENTSTAAANLGIKKDSINRAIVKRLRYKGSYWARPEASSPSV